MKLIDFARVLDVVGRINADNQAELEITGIAYDSRQVQAGDVFVAIRGYLTDGHKYLAQAIEKGAVALIVEEIDESIQVAQYQVPNSRAALSQASALFFNRPSSDLKVIGITATNGKTSTAFLTETILREHGLKTGIIGTVMVRYDGFMESSILTTPESYDLQQHFYKMKKAGVSHVVMEVSSSAMELDRARDVEYNIVTMNNISREHTDLHGSFDRYFETKASLIRDALPTQDVILNLDCPYTAPLADETMGKVFTYGIENDTGYLHCKNIDLSTGRPRFVVEVKKDFMASDGTLYRTQEFPIELSVSGYHSVYNSMAAISAAMLMGVPILTIQSGIQKFTGVERRFEIIYENDFKIIDDHFANVGNINVTLETMKFMDYQKLHLVYGIRGGRGVTTNRENAETIVKWADKLGIKEVIASLSVNHVGAKDLVTEAEKEVFLQVMDQAGIQVSLYEDLADATQHALNIVEADDVILLAGCQGMDYSGQEILRQVVKSRPDLDPDQVMSVLADRVAGVDH